MFKKYIPLILFSSLGLFTACNQKPQLAKQRRSTHTFKLQKSLSVTFKSQKTLDIKLEPDSKNMSVRIFLKNGGSKKLIDKIEVEQSGLLELNLPDDLSNYTYIIAVLEGTSGTSNSLVSSVDTYKIGEQELINAAKNRLKNRN